MVNHLLLSSSDGIYADLYSLPLSVKVLDFACLLLIDLKYV